MSAGSGGDRFRELEQAYQDYTVYDQHYEKVGRIDDIFVDANDEPEYIGVKTGFLGTKSTLVPIEIVRVNDRRRLVEVAADGETIKHAPTFDNDGDITPEYEDRVHGYFGLERPAHMQAGTGYGTYYDSPADPSRDEELRHSVDTEYGERTGSSTGTPGGTPEGTPVGTPVGTPATAPGPAATGDADVPPGDRGPLAEPPGDEPAASTADPLDADAATRTGGDTREGVEVQGESSVRVYKRAPRPSR